MSNPLSEFQSTNNVNVSSPSSLNEKRGSGSASLASGSKKLQEAGRSGGVLSVTSSNSGRLGSVGSNNTKQVRRQSSVSPQSQQQQERRRSLRYGEASPSSRQQAPPSHPQVSVVSQDVDMDEDGVLFEVSANVDDAMKIQKGLQQPTRAALLDAGGNPRKPNTEEKQHDEDEFEEEEEEEDDVAGGVTPSFMGRGSSFQNSSHSGRNDGTQQVDFFSAQAGESLLWCASRGTQCELMNVHRRQRRRSSFDGVVDAEEALKAALNKRRMVKAISVHSRANHPIVDGPLPTSSSSSAMAQGQGHDNTDHLAGAPTNVANDEVYCVPLGDYRAHRAQMIERAGDTDDTSSSSSSSGDGYDTQSDDNEHDAQEEGEKNEVGQQRRHHHHRKSDQASPNRLVYAETLRQVHRHHQPSVGAVKRMGPNAFSKGLSPAQLQTGPSSSSSSMSPHSSPSPRHAADASVQHLSPSHPASSSSSQRRVRDKITMTDVRQIWLITSFAKSAQEDPDEIRSEKRESPTTTIADDNRKLLSSGSNPATARNRGRRGQVSPKRSNNIKPAQFVQDKLHHAFASTASTSKGRGFEAKNKEKDHQRRGANKKGSSTTASASKQADSRVPLGSRFSLASPALKRTTSTSGVATKKRKQGRSTSAEGDSATARQQQQQQQKLAIEYYEGIGIILRPFEEEAEEASASATASSFSNKSPLEEKKLSSSRLSEMNAFTPGRSRSSAQAQRKEQTFSAAHLVAKRQQGEHGNDESIDQVQGTVDAAENEDAESSPYPFAETTPIKKTTLDDEDDDVHQSPPTPPRRANMKKAPHPASHDHHHHQHQHQHLPSVSRPYEIDERVIPQPPSGMRNVSAKTGTPMNNDGQSGNGRVDHEGASLSPPPLVSSSRARSSGRSKRKYNDDDNDHGQSPSAPSPRQLNLVDDASNHKRLPQIGLTPSSSSPRVPPSSSSTLPAHNATNNEHSGSTSLRTALLPSSAKRLSTMSSTSKVSTNHHQGGRRVSNYAPVSQPRSLTGTMQQHIKEAKQVQQERTTEFSRLFPDWPVEKIGQLVQGGDECAEEVSNSSNNKKRPTSKKKRKP